MYQDVFVLEESILRIHSDNAIYSLMAKDIITSKDFPIFFYGQNYMGPFTSWMIVLNQYIMNIFGVIHKVPYFNTPYIISPVAGALATYQLMLLGSLFWSLVIEKLFNSYTAVLCFIAALFGGQVLSDMAFHPNGVEMAYFLGPLILYIYFLVEKTFTIKEKFCFGFLVGFSWWMNQTVVFVLAPIILRELSKIDFFNKLRNNFSVKEVIKNHKIKSFLISLIFSLGLYFSYIGRFRGNIGPIKLKINSGTKPLFLSLAIFGLIYLLDEIKKDKKIKSDIVKLIIKLKYFILGFLVAYSPVWLGKYIGLYEKSYGVKFRIIPLKQSLEYWTTLISEYYVSIISAEKSSVIITTFLVLTILYQFIYKRAYKYLLVDPEWQTKKNVLLGVGLINIVYVMLSTRAMAENALRYSLYIPVLIVLLAINYSKNRIINYCLSLGLLFFLVTSNIKYIDKIKYSKVSEELKNLSNSNYNICYGNYWDAYRLEFLTNGEVEFIIHNSQVRTKKINELRKAIKADKCLYDTNEKTFSKFLGSN